MSEDKQYVQAFGLGDGGGLEDYEASSDQEKLEFFDRLIEENPERLREAIVKVLLDVIRDYTDGGEIRQLIDSKIAQADEAADGDVRHGARHLADAVGAEVEDKDEGEREQKTAKSDTNVERVIVGRLLQWLDNESERNDGTMNEETKDELRKPAAEEVTEEDAAIVTPDEDGSNVEADKDNMKENDDSEQRVAEQEDAAAKQADAEKTAEDKGVTEESVGEDKQAVADAQVATADQGIDDESVDELAEQIAKMQVALTRLQKAVREDASATHQLNDRLDDLGNEVDNLQQGQEDIKTTLNQKMGEAFARNMRGVEQIARQSIQSAGHQIQEETRKQLEEMAKANESEFAQVVRKHSDRASNDLMNLQSLVFKEKFVYFAKCSIIIMVIFILVNVIWKIVLPMF